MLETDKANVDLPAPTAGVSDTVLSLIQRWVLGLYRPNREGDKTAAGLVEAQQGATVENALEPAAEQVLKRR